jgi:crotonobetainyl-CoA:carnitine CoA-transferase CaiB-like acyl-CoA transferase
LKDAQDLEAFYNLVKTADVIVENFSPNVKNKLCIDYETLSHINPKIIYASLSGYGQGKDKKAYDAIIQAESGFMSLT